MSRPARRFWCLAVSLLLTTLVNPIAGAAPAQELPDAREVIDRHIEAVGGRDTIEGHTSSHAVGNIEILGQGLTGEVHIWAAAPDRTLMVVSFPAAGIESRTGYDGTVGWSIDPMTGERLLQGAELAQLVDESYYYSDLHDPDRFRSIEMVGQADFDGRQAYKLHLVYKSGREVFEYFAVDSGLMIGQEGTQESIMGSMNVVTTVHDYGRFDDVMVPTRIVQDVGGLQQVQIRLESIEFDTVDPAVFELPAAIEALVR